MDVTMTVTQPAAPVAAPPAEGYDEEIRKKLELVANREEAIRMVLAEEEQKFSQTAEGKEVEYLKQVHERYIKDTANFLAHFISEDHGKRGVDEVIEGLEHSDSHIKTDAKFIAMLKKLASGIAKESIPTSKEWIYYKTREKEAAELSTGDMQLFSSRLNALIKMLNGESLKREGLPERRITAQLKDYDRLPNIKSFKNFGTSLRIWKLLFARLNWTENIDKMVEFEKELESKNPNANRKLKDAHLPMENEVSVGKSDEFFKHLSSFEPGNAKKHPLYDVMETISEDDANEFVKLFDSFFLEGEKGGTVPTIKRIGEIFEKRKGSIKSVENAALGELRAALEQTTKEMEKDISKERDEFSGLVLSRIKSLEHEHAKRIEKLREMLGGIRVHSDKVALSSALAEEDKAEINRIDQTRTGFLIRVLDITRLMRARTALHKMILGTIDEARMNSEFDEVVRAGASPWAMKMVGSMRAMFGALTRGEIVQDQFNQGMADIDKLIIELKERLHPISINLNAMTDRKIKLAEEYKDLRDKGRDELDKSHDYARRSWRDLGRLGIHEERHSYLN
jgi:hypothetical protein